MVLIALIEQLNVSGDLVIVWRDGEIYLEPAGDGVAAGEVLPG
ncbi:MAG: hypothetical protein NW217_03860 [Hyphomicrobiaceae bacterium]|nr:hypothetical protein [Hyphomicrobiaceae bacterium]